MTIEEKIEHFSALSAEERRDLERYVSEDPRHAAALAEAKRWDALLRAAAALHTRPPSDEALAYYAVMERVDVDKMPQERAEAFARIEKAVGESAELRHRIEAFQRRRAELEQSSDAAAQFRRLASEPAPGGQRERGARPAGPSRRTRWMRRAVAAAIVLVTAYAVLLLASQLTRPAHERLASFHPSELSVEGFQGVRGTDAPGGVSDASSAYLAALDQLRRAESSFVGLFPRFNETRLDSAVALLRGVIEMEPDDSFLANEARFLLGKALLATGDVDEARPHLQRVVASRGRLQAEAAAILEQIRAP